MILAADFHLGSGIFVIHYLLPACNLNNILIIPHINYHPDLGFFLGSIGNNDPPCGFGLAFLKFDEYPVC